MNKSKGVTVWLTGLSGSGKTTIATELESLFKEKGFKVEKIDGDVLRETLSKDLGFSKEDRDTNVERSAFLAKTLNNHGVVAIVSLISPYREKRDWARNYIENFFEVYVNCPLGACEERDAKGLYIRARKGEIPDFTGISDRYEEPVNPELTLDTKLLEPKECALRIVKALKII
ncbi:MAG: Adenylyl-sulfate kinase [candidate division CPR2 bacterium GW2011_GWC1_39_9]|uniref:Adenylyl-sulfate kinase n=1 Tax=candidate division CPR2 bacterium GW2011_GWC2_39_10 TaxID=1618345 RepID=A0A0G0LP58_UNCC2|nr:MAG: Adenylyl-sulfate kinase [candidate division CPR2 bacterium GW2011_GWC2_39_10]KKR34188.1 MAG: Adenylyl-sulfate kinase [candidate division CPR2 bacterium GW2011_GWC1_39_9]